MLAGKRFKLSKDTLSLEKTKGPNTIVTVPKGAIIHVLAGPKDAEGLIDVIWEGRTLAMFEIDVKVRGTEVKNKSASA